MVDERERPILDEHPQVVAFVASLLAKSNGHTNVPVQLIFVATKASPWGMKLLENEDMQKLIRNQAQNPAIVEAVRSFTREDARAQHMTTLLPALISGSLGNIPGESQAEKFIELAKLPTPELSKLALQQVAAPAPQGIDGWRERTAGSDPKGKMR